MIIFLGWPVELVKPVGPVKKGIMSDFTFLTDKRANGKRTQPIQGKPI